MSGRPSDVTARCVRCRRGQLGSFLHLDAKQKADSYECNKEQEEIRYLSLTYLIAYERRYQVNTLLVTAVNWNAPGSAVGVAEVDTWLLKVKRGRTVVSGCGGKT